ncbi:hypothetical protein ABPG75_009014 [Micractinium tetrahymenae]
MGVLGARRRARHTRTVAAAATKQAPPRGPTTEPFILSSGIVDYYTLLGIDDYAPPSEIKQAYRTLAKVCHVDVAGDTEANRNMCILLNEAYEVLMDPEQRTAYNAELDAALADEDDGYTGEALSKWCANTKMGKNSDPAEDRAVFVDEQTCIGCKQCVWCAPATFRMEDVYGRSRVFGQWLDKEDDIQAAMDACPVSCIHWVSREDLPALEFVVRYKVKRTNVAAMMSAQGGAVDDVWAAAAKYLKERKRKEEDRARAARYSAAQEAARRAAAEALAARQDGWFDQFVHKFGISNMGARAATAMENAVFGASYSSDDEYAGYSKVGRRARSKYRVAGSYGARGASGGKVPRERALVPVGAALRPWRRE